jgi:hypothetical protein
MLANHEPDHDIEDLTDAEMYDAIRYLEPGPKNTKEMDEDDREKDNGVVICVCLYIGDDPVSRDPENERAPRRAYRLSQHFQQIRPHTSPERDTPLRNSIT